MKKIASQLLLIFSHLPNMTSGSYVELDDSAEEPGAGFTNK